MRYTVRKIGFYNLPAFIKVSKILKECGDDMYYKYKLKHWKNSYFKTLLIVIYMSLKNTIYGVFDNKQDMIATFQIKYESDCLHFAKLAVSPQMTGKGVGSFCLDEMEKMANQKKVHFLKCEVYEKSEHAYLFYLNRGFKKIRSIETFKYKEIMLEKIL